MSFIAQLNAVKGFARKHKTVTSVNGQVGDVTIVNAATVDTDTTFAANSDTRVASQKALKTTLALKINATALDTDVALTANSDAKIATQKATAAAIASATAAAITKSAAAATDAAIALKQGTVFITKAGVAVLTLAAPTAGTDDGSVLNIVDTSGHAHTVTTPANKLNTNKTTLTFDATIGSSATLYAKGGVWYAAAGNGSAIS